MHFCIGKNTDKVNLESNLKGEGCGLKVCGVFIALLYYMQLVKN